MLTRSALALLFVTQLPAQDVGIQLTNGIDSYLELPYDPQFAPQSGLTVEAWVTYDDSTVPTGAGVRYPTIARQHVSGGGQEAWFLRVNAGGSGTTQLRFRATTTGGIVIINYNFAPGQLQTWTHVAATFDANLVAMYVGGNLVASAPGTGFPLVDAGGDLRVGKGATLSGGAANEVWNGQIDELRIWPFARTQADIQATRNDKLVGVPGLVATWNFDNTFVDTSSFHILTEVGTVGFAANPLSFATPPMGSPFGTGTAGCLGDMFVTPASAPLSGNADFALACTRLPPNALAVWAGALGSLAMGVPVLGFEYWLDPASTVTAAAFGDAFGTLRLDLSLPPGLAGIVLAFQAVSVDPCGTQGFTASYPTEIVLQ